MGVIRADLAARSPDRREMSSSPGGMKGEMREMNGRLGDECPFRGMGVRTSGVGLRVRKASKRRRGARCCPHAPRLLPRYVLSGGDGSSDVEDLRCKVKNLYLAGELTGNECQDLRCRVPDTARGTVIWLVDVYLARHRVSRRRWLVSPQGGEPRPSIRRTCRAGLT